MELVCADFYQKNFLSMRIALDYQIFSKNKHGDIIKRNEESVQEKYRLLALCFAIKLCYHGSSQNLSPG